MFRTRPHFASLGRRVLPNCTKKSNRARVPVAFLGAGNGNRTRTASLGSWSSTTKLYLHLFIYFTITDNFKSSIIPKIKEFIMLYTKNSFSKTASPPFRARKVQVYLSLYTVLRTRSKGITVNASITAIISSLSSSGVHLNISPPK